MSTPRLILDIEKRFPNFILNIGLQAGAEILVLFGPSGAGKTQTLNAIAGLVKPDAGEIVLDDVVYFRRRAGETPINLPARGRRVGYVFQQYALFPHLTAIENVEFPLFRQQGARRRASQLLEQMHLDNLADRYPHEMSGGQQQRVAIARALAAESKVLLLDEPFSALEKTIRMQLHKELVDLQAESGLVIIYVTHNLEDALAVGDRLAVMHKGRIEQIGKPDEILLQPRSNTVLNSLGLPNVFTARIIRKDDREMMLDWKGLQFRAGSAGLAIGDEITAYLPAGAIRLDPDRPADAICGKIVRVQQGVTVQRIYITLANGEMLEAAADQAAQWIAGQTVALTWSADRLIICPGC